jgi:predicted enzyme involved in methoxymalonyl-ACP biosynthesis
VVFTRTTDAVCEIDTLLMSCRVIGRGVETALLGYLVDQAIADGCRKIHGWFLPTAKNAPCAQFYRDHGFTIAEQRDSGTLWQLELSSGRRVAIPDWITLRQTHGQESGARNDS